MPSEMTKAKYSLPWITRETKKIYKKKKKKTIFVLASQEAQTLKSILTLLAYIANG